MNINGAVRHSLYTGEIRRIPSYVNSGNCREYGIAKSAMEKCVSHGAAEENYDFATSDIDSMDALEYSMYDVFDSMLQ